MYYKRESTCIKRKKILCVPGHTFFGGKPHTFTLPLHPLPKVLPGLPNNPNIQSQSYRKLKQNIFRVSLNPLHWFQAMIPQTELSLIDEFCSKAKRQYMPFGYARQSTNLKGHWLFSLIFFHSTNEMENMALRKRSWTCVHSIIYKKQLSTDKASILSYKVKRQ